MRTIAIIFQSTRPIRGATMGCTTICKKFDISIHAPHTGRDQDGDVQAAIKEIFQSTRPIRGATRSDVMFRSSSAFQSTRPIRGATADFGACKAEEQFQSTRPIRGATQRVKKYVPN